VTTTGKCIVAYQTAQLQRSSLVCSLHKAGGSGTQGHVSASQRSTISAPVCVQHAHAHTYTHMHTHTHRWVDYSPLNLLMWQWWWWMKGRWAWHYSNCCMVWSPCCHCNHRVAILLIWMIFYEVRTWSLLPCDAMLAWYMLPLSVYMCVCPSHAGVVSKWLMVGSCKQHYTIAQGFLVPPPHTNGLCVLAVAYTMRNEALRSAAWRYGTLWNHYRKYWLSPSLTEF